MWMVHARDRRVCEASWVHATPRSDERGNYDEEGLRDVPKQGEQCPSLGEPELSQADRFPAVHLPLSIMGPL